MSNLVSQLSVYKANTDTLVRDHAIVNKIINFNKDKIALDPNKIKERTIGDTETNCQEEDPEEVETMMGVVEEETEEEIIAK